MHTSCQDSLVQPAIRQHSPIAGIQGMKEHKGELWGMGNLFRESLHKVTAQEIFSNERPDVHYHMRRMDTQQYGRLLLLV